MDDVAYMRVKFYVDGSKRKGTVHVDLKKVSWFMSSMNMMAINLYTNIGHKLFMQGKVVGEKAIIFFICYNIYIHA